MVKENNRKKYQPPSVDLLECRVERGFLGSLEGFSYGNYYGSPSGTGGSGSGRAEGFSNGNSYGGNKFN